MLILRTAYGISLNEYCEREARILREYNIVHALRTFSTDRLRANQPHRGHVYVYFYAVLLHDTNIFVPLIKISRRTRSYLDCCVLYCAVSTPSGYGMWCCLCARGFCRCALCCSCLLPCALRAMVIVSYRACVCRISHECTRPVVVSRDASRVNGGNNAKVRTCSRISRSRSVRQRKYCTVCACGKIRCASM